MNNKKQISLLEVNLIEIVKECCLKNSKYWESGVYDHCLKHGDSVMAQLGALTPDIASAACQKIETVRRKLKKMESEGQIFSRGNRGGCIRWWPLGLAQEILNERSCKN